MKRLFNFGIFGVFVVSLFAASVYLFFSSVGRSELRELFAPPERKILSVANGRIFPDKDGRVFKISTPDGLLLEIYGPLEGGLQPLVDRIALPEKRDAFFQFQGRAVNLALKDMDGDGIFEIIAPSYDSSLVPHLNIFRYNKSSGHFEPYIE